jgi:streptomycin 6-kinase
MFTEYLARWGLTPDGDPIVTHGSRLLPVRQGGVPAMLKVATEAEEKFGGLLMSWWDGEGAARVLAHDGEALLLERAEGKTSLSDMARHGRDEEATRIICDVVARLHARRGRPPPHLIPLAEWFRELEPAAAQQGGILALSAATARALLAAPQDVVVLHGDIYHDNILDFGARGWLAIDPMRLIGERGFDYANLFCNPDYETATAPDRFARRLAVVAEAAALERQRLLRWILAWAGLSVAWFLDDGVSLEIEFKVAEMAAAELNR